MASWLAGLEESGLARATRRKYQVIVSDVFDCVATYTNDATFHNELRKVPKPKQRARRRRFPPTEIIHFLGTVAACTLPERVAVRLCAYVGMRIGEVLALRHKDVFEMPSGVVLNVEFTRDRYGLRPRKNSDSERMHQPTLDAETANLVLQLRATPGEYLLPWKHSTPTAVIRRWRRTFPQIAESMPAGDGWHILRHWGATTVASLPGACEVDVQAWLGNSTSAAAQTYMNQVRGTTRNASAAHIVRAVGPPPPLQLGLGLGGATGPPGAGTSAAMGTPIPMAARTDSSSHFSNQNFNQKGKNHD
jgi:integrase